MKAEEAGARYTTEALERMRGRCDPLADAVAARCKRSSPRKLVDGVMARAQQGSPAERALLEQMNSVPEWVDWATIERGRQVSLAFANVRAIALLVSSLIEGYSLARASRVLVATGRLQQDVQRRLAETGQLTHNMHVPGGMRPGGAGHRTILEVRLLHAMVRRYLREKGDWDTEHYGEPINQEDMAFTVIEFDYLSLRGMEAMGCELRPEDREALHHLWRYASYLNGVDDFFLTENLDEEIAQYRAICAHQQAPNDESRQLVEAVLNAVAGRPPFYFSKAFLYELTRRCLGEALADAFQLPRSGWQARKVDLLVAANGLTTRAHYGVPGNRWLSQTLNLSLFRRNLKADLPAEPAKWAFKHVA